MPTRLRVSLPIFLPLFVGITTLSLLIFLVVQQVIRQSATDVLYVSGEAMVNIVKTQRNLAVNGKMTDLASYPQVYIMTFNQNQKMVSTTTTHNGNPVVFPKQVFNQVSSNPYSFTWTPEKNLRQAVLIYKITSPEGYVVMGRSLKVPEERIGKIARIIIPSWLLISLLTLATTVSFAPHPKKKRMV